MPADTAALRANRDFVLLWVGEASSQLGLQIAVVAYPLLVLGITGSAALAGVVGFARTLPWLVLSLPAGALIDRLNRKSVMVLADGLASAALISIPICIWLVVLTVPQISVVAFVEGACIVFFHIAETAAVRSVVRAEQLPDAIAANDGRAYAARITGTSVGGALFGLSRALPFLMDSISYVASLFLVSATRQDFQEPRAARRSHFVADVAEAARWLWAQPFLRTALLLVGASNLAFAGVTLAAVVVAKNQGSSPFAVGLMLAFGGVGGMLGAIAAPHLRRRLSPRLVVVGINWIDAVVIAAFAIAPDALVLGALLALLSFAGPTWNAVVDGYRISIIPDALIGRAQSLDSLVAFGSASLGPLLAGVLLEAFGGDTTFVLFAGLMLGVGIASTVVGALRQLDAAPRTL